MDDLIVTHNYTDAKDDELILDFAYLCINNRPDIKALMNHYIYPVGLSVSMMCFILTFLLYSFLPQLRDLTENLFLAFVLLCLLPLLLCWLTCLVGKIQMLKN